MSITEKTPIELVSSHRVDVSLFFRVTSLYKTSTVLAIPFPLKNKECICSPDWQTCLSINTGFVTKFVTNWSRNDT